MLLPPPELRGSGPSPLSQGNPKDALMGSFRIPVKDRGTSFVIVLRSHPGSFQRFPDYDL